MTVGHDGGLGGAGPEGAAAGGSPLTEWADRVEAAIGAGRIRCVQRVIVLAETGSTQDAAARWACGVPGLLVLAGRQSRGRGRIGRAWEEGAGGGLAMTLVLDARAQGLGRLSLAAGIAARGAIQGMLGEASQGVDGSTGRRSDGGGVGLRWPNDVVWRADGRKLAGVLIEAAGPLALLGIGVNVGQRAGDWPAHLAGTAVSIGQLLGRLEAGPTRETGAGRLQIGPAGLAPDRIEVAQRVLMELDAALGLGEDELAARWRGADVLVGTEATFASGGRRVTGVVERIEPTSQIVVRTAGGRMERLGAMATSLVK